MSKQTVDEKIQEALRDKAFDEFYLIYAKAKDAILDNEFFGGVTSKGYLW